MKRGEQGLTLIEVLIAISLVGLLMVGLVTALRIGVNAMSHANERLMANRRIVGAQRVLEQQIAGLIPVTAECASEAGQRGAKVPFFEGQSQSMRFVSSYSLHEGQRGIAQMLEFQVIPRDTGGVRLVVNEIPYTGSRSAGAVCTGRAMDPEFGLPVTQFQPIQTGPSSFVLADKLAYCRLLYQDLRPRQGEFPVWRDRWASEKWPSAVRIEMAPMQENANALHMVTVTAPVRVDRSFQVMYEDN